MIEKIHGIVVDVRKHSDTASVVTLFTRTRGRVSFVTPVARGKKSRARSACLFPLSVIEADVSFRENNELQHLGSFSLFRVWRNLYFNPVKSSLAIFLSEFLHRFLKAAAPDRFMWDYIVDAVSLIDRWPGPAANLHLAFLVSLLPLAGIFPNFDDYEDGDILDMQTGRCVAAVPSHRNYLLGDDVRVARLICRMNFRNAGAFRFSREQRTRVLRALLGYYAIHYPGTDSLKSLDIMQEVFS